MSSKIFNSIVSLTIVISALTSHAGDIKNRMDILGGALTRAGVKGQTQLSDKQLVQLCEEGYTRAYFLYSGADARSISCSRGTITYRSIKWLSPDPILQDINDALTGNGGRVFVHCNNGAHASGFIAAIALRQFCGLSADEAMDYWNDTLNGYGIPPGIKKIQSGVNSYTTQPGLLQTRCSL